MSFNMACLSRAAMFIALMQVMGCGELSSFPGLGEFPMLSGQEEDVVVGLNIMSVTPSAGGVMKVSKSTLNIPPGAVHSTYECSFKITKKKPPEGLKNTLKRVYEFGPDGEQFAVPVSLVVPFDDTD